MYSTHNQLARSAGTAKRLARWALAGAAACSTWGCAHGQKPSAPELSQTPLIIDGAMQKRDWDRSVALYASGGVPAWNTRFHYEPSAREPAWIKPVSEPAEFLGQTAFLPVTLITARPFTPVIYRGVQEPASSTAFPAPPDVTLSQQQKSSNATGGASGASGAYGGSSGGAGGK